MVREVHNIQGCARGSDDDEVSLSMILKRIKNSAKEQQQSKQRMSAESTQETGDNFCQSSFVRKDLRKEPFETWLQKIDLNVKDLDDRFKPSNRLDEQDNVMIHVIENLEQENANGAHHYCPFNINLRDKTFEVFDSLRTINKSKRLDEVARCIVAALRMLWEKSYLKQTIMMEKFTPENIDALKQVVL
ncbi:hypothetical protein D1007_35932 [Hordeum vulgare]|nr:hypothetical protein D1007_35932 [Hordeum vulgare]